MDKNHDGTVTQQEFIDVFLKAESVLKEKISQCQFVIEDCQRQKQDVVNKRNEAARTEKFNSYNIKEGSVVAITILEVSGLRVNPGQQIEVKVFCGEDVYEGVSARYTDKAVFNKNNNNINVYLFNLFLQSFTDSD